jgi:hypothetical protein
MTPIVRPKRRAVNRLCACVGPVHGFPEVPTALHMVDRVGTFPPNLAWGEAMLPGNPHPPTSFISEN